MAAPVISISLNLSDESVGSSIPQVILIGSISVEVLLAPEVGTVVVASPTGVREIDTHSLSEADPIESLLPHVSVAPMVSPFLCLEYSESNTKMPERHVSPTPHDTMLARWGSRVASRSSSPTTSTSEIPIAPIPPAPSDVVAPSTDIISPVDAPPRIPLRYTLHHLDRFTSGSSSDLSSLDHSSSGHSTSDHSLFGHSNSDHSSSGHSTSGHSSSGHTLPVTTIADSSTPSRFVYPPLAKTSRYSERFRDSISPEDSVEEDINADVLADIKADATAIEVAADMDVEARVDAGIGMEVDVRVYVEDEVEGEVESSDRGTMEVGVDVVDEIGIPDGMLMPDVVKRLEQVEEVV
ncbi:hypothetical protein Tco_0930879 [Tanacetum coccineum]